MLASLSWHDVFAALLASAAALGTTYIVTLVIAETWHASKERFHDRIMRKYN